MVANFSGEEATKSQASDESPQQEETTTQSNGDTGKW